MKPQKIREGYCTACGDKYNWIRVDGVLLSECVECRREIRRRYIDRHATQPAFTGMEIWRKHDTTKG
jgi:Zn ribbon nucleic-acid-binding protein